MESCAQSGDHQGFYNEVLNFTAAGISATQNPALLQVIMGVMPILRRLQFVAIQLKAGAINDNSRYFKTIIDALETRDVEKGMAAMAAYVEAEKTFALTAIKQSDWAHFLWEEE